MRLVFFTTFGKEAGKNEKAPHNSHTEAGDRNRRRVKIDKLPKSKAVELAKFEDVEDLVFQVDLDHPPTHLRSVDFNFRVTSAQDPAKPLGPWVLEEQMAQLCRKIKTHSDAGLHALRHTFLTEAGEYTDPFTLQYVAGHDNIKTTMRYAHPREEAVEKLFVRLGNLERPEGV